jgi:hypothetical protein
VLIINAFVFVFNYKSRVGVLSATVQKGGISGVLKVCCVFYCPRNKGFEYSKCLLDAVQRAFSPFKEERIVPLKFVSDE